MTRKITPAKAEYAEQIGAPSLSMLVLERKRALADIVAERIRDAIVFGELSLGQAVSEDRLATRLGVSRTPVREALTSLQLQGLVIIKPQRGSFVFQPTQTDVDELCEFRSMLELGALSLAHTRKNNETLIKLQAAEDEMEAAVQRGDDRGAAKADATFHEVLLAGCGNRFLVQSYTLISGRLGAIRYMARRSAESRHRAAREHRAIIKALKRSDVAGATEVLGAHIDNMRAHFRSATSATADDGR